PCRAGQPSSSRTLAADRGGIGADADAQGFGSALYGVALAWRRCQSLEPHTDGPCEHLFARLAAARGEPLSHGAARDRRYLSRDNSPVDGLPEPWRIPRMVRRPSGRNAGQALLNQTASDD